MLRLFAGLPDDVRLPVPSASPHVLRDPRLRLRTLRIFQLSADHERPLRHTEHQLQTRRDRSMTNGEATVPARTVRRETISTLSVVQFLLHV